jgi:hypothetical protein
MSTPKPLLKTLDATFRKPIVLLRCFLYGAAFQQVVETAHAVPAVTIGLQENTVFVTFFRLTVVIR